MKFPGISASQNDYLAWREFKLSQPNSPQLITLKRFSKLDSDELAQLSRQIERYNMAFFSVTKKHDFNSEDLKLLGKQLGLNRLDKNLYADEDAISELRVINKGRRGEYIPYTSRALGWHTDGYYNPEERTIRAFMLYCQQDAAEGGINQLLDPELVYIHIYDQKPEYIHALMQPDTFTIPETVEDGQLIRPQQHSPVFGQDPATGALHMRYTQRKTYIQWKDDDTTTAALSLLGDLLASDSDSILTARLNPGEGLICNNVLHNRSAFTDSIDKSRVMYRARYYDRLSPTL